MDVNSITISLYEAVLFSIKEPSSHSVATNIAKATAMIGSYLDKQLDEQPSIESVVEHISEFVQLCIENKGKVPNLDTSYLSTIVGHQGTMLIYSGKSVSLHVEQPNPSSPKRLFKIVENPKGETEMDKNTSTVEKVLFGNQKQASVVNHAVTSIITTQLMNMMFNDKSLSALKTATVDDVVDILTGFVEYAIGHHSEMTEPEKIALKLVVGNDSYFNIITEGSKCQLIVEQPNAESPKHTFRVYAEEQADAKDDEGRRLEVVTAAVEEMDDKQLEVIQQSIAARNNLATMSKSENFRDRAEAIKAAILPIISEGVKRDIPDNEWAQALCCAEYYYDFHSSDVAAIPVHQSKPAADNSRKAPSQEEIDKIVRMWKGGNSLANIMQATSRPIEQVKYILNSKGFQVH